MNDIHKVGTSRTAGRFERGPDAAPVDANGFVAEAEQIFNSRNCEAALAVYSMDAVIESVTDGTSLVAHGAQELRSTIMVLFSVAEARSINVRKELVASTEGTIVNTWEGTVGRRRTARGIEAWTFDADGKVYHHRMWTFLYVRSESSPVQLLRVALLSPRTALSFARARLRM